MNTGEMIQQFIKLRDAVEARTKTFEAEMKPYRDGMAAIENAVSAQIIELGGESIKTEHGTAYRTEILSVRMADRQAFLRFVFDGEKEEFLTAAISKPAVQEYIEQHNALPPGVDVTKILKTNFRRS